MVPDVLIDRHPGRPGSAAGTGLGSVVGDRLLRSRLSVETAATCRSGAGPRSAGCGPAAADGTGSRHHGPMDQETELLLRFPASSAIMSSASSTG